MPGRFSFSITYMNISNSFSVMKKLTFILLTMTAIGLIAVPARADEAVRQNSRQNSYINGDYNTSVQESTQINRSGGYQGSSDQGNGSYQRQGRVNIPRGHYPPPGECKVWDPALPPGQQSPPIPCSSLPTDVYGDGRIIIYSDGTQEPY